MDSEKEHRCSLEDTMSEWLTSQNQEKPATSFFCGNNGIQCRKERTAPWGAETWHQLTQKGVTWDHTHSTFV